MITNVEFPPQLAQVNIKIWKGGGCVISGDDTRIQNAERYKRKNVKHWNISQ